MEPRNESLNERADAVRSVESNIVTDDKARLSRPLRGLRTWHAGYGWTASTRETLSTLDNEYGRQAATNGKNAKQWAGSRIPA